MFESLYLDILNKHAPQKQTHTRGNQIPFMNEQWRKAIRDRNKLWKKFTHQRTDANYAEYKKQRNKFTSISRKAIKDHFKNKSETDNPRAFWEAYRPFMHSRSSKQANDITLIENDVVITDKKELAELFNNYFVHIIDDVQDIKEHNFGHEFSAHPSIRAIAEENRRKNAIHNFNFKYTNKNQSEKLLLNINARKACGHDTITPRLLKESASVISGPLAELMNESIKQCKYPSRWKMGQVTPLFKKNDELSKENYRPVTVLPALNNVFEKLLASQLDQFYTELLSDYISAYRRHYGCETSLMRLTEDWKRSLDKKQIVAVYQWIYLRLLTPYRMDFLLAKLKAYGVNSRSCMLLKDYLHGRMQQVKVGDTSSDWQEVRRGVPQGSVLGPMFFNIFINDLFLQIKTVQLNMYADDGQLYTADTDPVSLERRISREVSSANAWYEINGMIANPSKHQGMILGKQDSDKLDLSNKRILRFIFKDFNSEYNNLLKRAGTVNLKDKRLQNMILIIFKCVRFSDYPRYLKDMFRLRPSTYFLRGHNMLCLPKPLTTSYGINSFSYLAAISWNSLTDHHRTISDFTSFRRLLSTG